MIVMTAVIDHLTPDGSHAVVRRLDEIIEHGEKLGEAKRAVIQRQLRQLRVLLKMR
jgi:hypothetical protein